MKIAVNSHKNSYRYCANSFDEREQIKYNEVRRNVK